MPRAKAPPPRAGDDPLATYRAKRDFSRTAEPAGLEPMAPGRRFVVHQHHATANHYDLRLELDGVLKSWAVPKGPSLDPADRRLAVETEDHPLDYIDYEGVIPEGSYGAGPTIVWDNGAWAPMGEDAAADLAAGTLKFRLSGQKLDGGYMLTRLKPKAGERRRNWLLIKERDPAAAAGRDILAERPESVKTGRLIDQLVAPAADVSRPKSLRPDRVPGSTRGILPDRVPPQLATEADTPPEGDGWLHEIKLDGYRTLARVEDSAARLITRAGLDWSHRYGDLPVLLAALPCRTAMIDGEIVVLDAQGVSHFAYLQAALSEGRSERLVFFAFDLLHLNGWDLTGAPLTRRKALLAQLLAAAPPGLQFGSHVEGDGATFFARAAELGLEGVVSKRDDAPYRPGRSKAWVKAKARLSGEFPVIGYTASAAAGGLGALAVAERRGATLAYAGKVGTGFAAGDHERLLARLEPLRDGAERLPGLPKDVVPVRPELTARVHFATRTRDGALRHAVFQGLHEPAAARPRPRLVSEQDLARIHITNPTRRLFGRSGPTKLDVAVYYAAIGDVMLPHLFGRPVSLVRCPTGKPGDCFFQRHAFTGMPKGIAVVDTRSSGGEDRSYLAVETAMGYLALPQFGVVEFHSWGARAADIDHPDRAVFDLDPGEGITWREVVEAAIHVRDELRRLGLVPFAKTTGGRGIHVVVPLVPRADWKSVHATTGRIAKAIEATAPATFVTTMGEKNRRGRIFIDFHRNARSATAVAPWSLRARNSLPASAPLGWEMLADVDAPDDLNYSTLPALVATTGDPWADIDAHARELPAQP